MRVTLVGPAYPWRGGLPLLVTDLAHRLAADGHAVRVLTWMRQGPARLVPTQTLTATEGTVFPAKPVLSWRNPLGGWRVGRAAAASDLVIVVHYTTIQAPVLWAVAPAATAVRGSSRSARTSSRTKPGLATGRSPRC